MLDDVLFLRPQVRDGEGVLRPLAAGAGEVMASYTCGVCGKTIPDYNGWVDHGCEGKARRGGASTVISDEFIPLPGGGTGTRAERDAKMAAMDLAPVSDYSDATLSRNRRERDRESKRGFSPLHKRFIYEKMMGRIPANQPYGGV